MPPLINVRTQLFTTLMSSNPREFHPRSDFWGAMTNDLHTPTALTVVWAVVKDEALSNQDKLALLNEFDTVLGLQLSESARELSNEEQEIIHAREQARQDKNWPESDRLRDRLLDQHGIQIKDTKAGTQWIRILP